MRKFLVMGAVGLACAAPAYAVNLVEALAAARAHDATFAAAGFSREAGSEKRWQGLAPLLPQVGASASYTRTDNTLVRRAMGSTSSEGDNDRKSYGVSVTQTVFDWAKFANLEIGRQRSLIAEDQYRGAEQDLILRVAKAYFDVLLAEDALSFTRAAKEAFARQLAQAKAAFDVGTATIVDTYEAQANFDGAVATEIAAENDLTVKRNAFESLTDRSPEKLDRLKPKLPLSLPQPADVAHWLARAAEANPELLAAHKQWLIAKKDVEVARAGHLPTVQLKANFGRDATNYRLGGNANDTIGESRTIAAEVVIPLFAGGGAQSQLREKAALASQAQENFEATRRRVEQETRAAFLGVTAGASQVKARENALKSSKSQLDATRLGREVGVRTSLDQLNAEQRYQQARRDLAQSRYDYLQARLKLAALTGDLSPAVLADINLLLDKAT